nr:putative membrane protein [Quercus suber]
MLCPPVSKPTPRVHRLLLSLAVRHGIIPRLRPVLHEAAGQYLMGTKQRYSPPLGFCDSEGDITRVSNYIVDRSSHCAFEVYKPSDATIHIVWVAASATRTEKTMAHEQRILSIDTAYTGSTLQYHSSTAPLTGQPSTSTVDASPYAEHGVGIDRSPAADLRNVPANDELRWPRIRHALREPLAEFLGTFILVMFGDGAVAQVVLSDGEKGDYISIAWGYVS